MRTLVRSPFARFARLLPFAGAIALAVGCASSGASAPSEPRPIAVSLYGYGSAPFRLVSESHTSRVQLYSEEQGSASTKVLNDEVMAALIEHLEELGYRTYARPGHTPASAPGRTSASSAKSFEVDENGAITWWPLVEGASLDELKSFQVAMRDFIDLYNISQSWQSVDNTLGGDYFDRKKAGR